MYTNIVISILWVLLSTTSVQCLKEVELVLRE